MDSVQEENLVFLQFTPLNLFRAKNLGFFGGVVRVVGLLETGIGTLLASIMTFSIMSSGRCRLTFIIGAIFAYIS